MILRRAHFKNFGILRDQIMEAIHPGLVIIAGGNRAGKTTLMLALRYLGYGLPKRDFIPSPLAGQHDYDVDVELWDQSRYNIHILGNSKPKVSPLGSWRELGIDEIFNNLDSFTYRQVFTISLDELRRIPEGLATREEQRLQAVLLGGGWVDALRLVKFQKEFAKKAYDLGRTRGAKNVGEFRIYAEIIKEGLAARDEANKQLESYDLKKQELTKLKQETLPRIEDDLQNLRIKLETWEIVKEHYDKYQKMLLLKEKWHQNEHLWTTYPEDGFHRGRQLKKEYEENLKEHEKSLRAYASATGRVDPDVFLAREKVLLAYQRELSGWKEKVASYRRNEQSYLDEENNLKQKLVQLNAKWEADLSILDHIATDLVNKGNLRDNMETYRQTRDRREQIVSQIKKVHQSFILKQEAKKQFVEKEKPRPKGLLAMTGLGLVFVFLLAIFNPAVSLAAGFLLAVALYLYFQSRQAREGEFKSRLSLMAKESEDLQRQLVSLEIEEKTLQETLQAVREKLDHTVRALGLPGDVSYFQLVDLYGEIINLKERYSLWLENKEKLGMQRQELKIIFKETSSVLGSLYENISVPGEHFSVPAEIFAAVEKAVQHLGLAQGLKRAETVQKELEENIKALLQKENPALLVFPERASAELPGMLGSFVNRGDRYQELRKEVETYENLCLDLETSLQIERRKEILLKNEPPGGDVLSAYGKYFNAFSSLEEIGRRYDVTAEGIKKLELQRESLLKEKALLEMEIRNLSSDQKLREAHQKISAAKNKLGDLAEKYATYRLAELMVNKVHKTFLEGTKGSILNSAGILFEEITAGDYGGLDLPGVQPEVVGSTLDFKVKEKEGKGIVSTHQLSRATKEQLFLAVRLSRIRSIKPLPVIFDDSLVNFDPNHSRQAARLIAKMAETHQVFVLTCHPEFINYLQGQVQSAQCWGLEKGKISGPFDTFAAAANLLNP